MTDLFGNPDPVAHKNLTIDPIKTAEGMGYNISEIRRKFYRGQWYFAYMDVISVLTDSKSPRRYATELKNKLKAEGSELFGHIEQLKIIAPDGKLRSTQCLSQVDILRLIEEIPSPKAEPLKREIARLANERMEEIANPGKGVENAVRRWKEMGKSSDWIDARIKGVQARHEETEALASHGISHPKDFAHFTDRTNMAVYGHKAKAEKAGRGIVRSGNLRDRSTKTELILLSLHEHSCALGIEARHAYGRKQVDRVYDVVDGVVIRAKQELASAFGIEEMGA